MSKNIIVSEWDPNQSFRIETMIQAVYPKVFISVTLKLKSFLFFFLAILELNSKSAITHFLGYFSCKRKTSPFHVVEHGRCLVFAPTLWLPATVLHGNNLWFSR